MYSHRHPTFRVPQPLLIGQARQRYHFILTVVLKRMHSGRPFIVQYCRDRIHYLKCYQDRLDYYLVNDTGQRRNLEPVWYSRVDPCAQRTPTLPKRNARPCRIAWLYGRVESKTWAKCTWDKPDPAEVLVEQRHYLSPVLSQSFSSASRLTSIQV